MTEDEIYSSVELLQERLAHFDFLKNIYELRLVDARSINVGMSLAIMKTQEQADRVRLKQYKRRLEELYESR